MRPLARPRPPLSDEENPYWVSFSDLMSGLLIIFILAAVALIIELTQKSEKWDEVLAQVKALGYATLEVAVSEFQQMDGGLSCLSLRY